MKDFQPRKKIASGLCRLVLVAALAGSVSACIAGVYDEGPSPGPGYGPGYGYDYYGGPSVYPWYGGVDVDIVNGYGRGGYGRSGGWHGGGRGSGRGGGRGDRR